MIALKVSRIFEEEEEKVLKVMTHTDEQTYLLAPLSSPLRSFQRTLWYTRRDKALEACDKSLYCSYLTDHKDFYGS